MYKFIYNTCYLHFGVIELGCLVFTVDHYIGVWLMLGGY